MDPGAVCELGSDESDPLDEPWLVAGVFGMVQLQKSWCDRSTVSCLGHRWTKREKGGKKKNEATKKKKL